jgi:HK97 gp10 family phage protein
MVDQVEVTGLAELRETLLKDLPEALQGKASQLALARAAAVIVTDAKLRAPARADQFVGPLPQGQRPKGNLRSAIYSYRNRDSTRTYESRFIGVRRRAWYWKFIEFGRGIVKPKRLKEKTRNSRISRGSPTNERETLGTPAKGWFGKEVQAVPARPFLRPAFEANKLKAIEVYRESVLPAIKRVSERARRKSLRSIRRALVGR